MKNKNPGSPHSSMMDDTSRHSCDELMMTRSLYEAETSDTASQVCSNVRWVMGFLTWGWHFLLTLNLEALHFLEKTQILYLITLILMTR